MMYNIKSGKNSIINIITNFYILAGIFLYIIGALLLIIALRSADLTSLYPVIATSYIWVALMSNYFFNDSLNFYKITGILFIILGVSLVGIGSQEKKRYIVKDGN